jgi:uncharacterized protein
MAVKGPEAAKVKGYNPTECHAALQIETMLRQGIHPVRSPPPPLKLHADTRSISFSVTAYGDDHVAVNGRVLARSLLLLPDRIDETWGPANFAALALPHLEALVALPCDVLLLGTGRRQRFPPPTLLRPLIEAGRSVEIMDTGAACRTYNILVAEGRAVAAALIIELPHSGA